MVSFSLAFKSFTWSEFILIFDIFNIGIDNGCAYFWSLLIILFLFDLSNIKMLGFRLGYWLGLKFYLLFYRFHFFRFFSYKNRVGFGMFSIDSIFLFLEGIIFWRSFEVIIIFNLKCDFILGLFFLFFEIMLVEPIGIV